MTDARVAFFVKYFGPKAELAEVALVAGIEPQTLHHEHVERQPDREERPNNMERCRIGELRTGEDERIHCHSIMQKMFIRSEAPGDFSQIEMIHRSTFDREAEAQLVDLLRKEGSLVLSLVAEEDGKLIGHACFSSVSVDGVPSGAILAPVAVVPGSQNKGIGSALIKEGIKEIQDRGVEILFVLGDPSFYRKFGFSSALAAGFSAPYGGDNFQAIVLNEQKEHLSGKVTVSKAFEVVD